MEDKRFSHIVKDPKFRRIPKNQSKVKIDKRFQSMFRDKKFQIKYTVDKRGRPVKHHSKEDLKRYYEVSSEEEKDTSEDDTEESDNDQFEASGVNIQTLNEDEDKNQLNTKYKNDKHMSEDIKEKLKDLNIDYARGEQNLFSESSSDDEETDEELSESEEIDHRWGELDGDAEKTDDATYRLAACNLDWDRIRAIDLMILFNSFLPAGGVIHSVSIYPSEFGKQRLKEEEVKGPIELVDSQKDLSDNETEEGSQYHMEKLRQYQLNRLKYYYAVIIFDSVSSANKVYTECDGMEYESSATKIDLRFIPDDMTFDDPPKEIADKLPDKYEPRFFTTTALQQAKVDLTWDETNPDRLEFTEKINSGKLDDISKDMLHNYLADSSSEDEIECSGNDSDSDNNIGTSGNVIDKYKALLQDIQHKEEKKNNKKFEMEISWDIDAKGKTDKIMKEKLENSEEKTPFQKYLDKRKEKRKEKKKKNKTNEQDSESESDMPSGIDISDPYFAEEFNNSEFKNKNSRKNGKNNETNENEDQQKQAELDLLLMNSEDNDQKHFSLKKIQDMENESKSKKKKYKKIKDPSTQNEDNFEMNVDDKRFSALFTSHHFNIDPTDPHYKKTKAMDKLVQEKLKRRNEEIDDINVKKIKTGSNQKKDIELNILVKNIKRKAQGFKNK